MYEKDFLAAAIGLLTTGAQAQVTSVVVNNTTGCDVCFELYGDVAGNCGTSYTSGIICIGAGGSVNYADPSTLSMTCASCTPTTLSATDEFYAGKTYDTDLVSGCASVGNPVPTVGEPCTGHQWILPMRLFDSNCTLCGGNAVQVSWTTIGSTGYLDIF